MSFAQWKLSIYLINELINSRIYGYLLYFTYLIYNRINK